MTNKGQSLVIFVLLFPIIFLLITLVWELGNISLIENKLNSEIKHAINYYFAHENEEDNIEKTKELLEKNIDAQQDVQVAEETIKIHINKQYNAIYKAILKDKFNIDITYIGYKENEKIIIKKE